jgi:hypothetical protein
MNKAYVIQSSFPHRKFPVAHNPTIDTQYVREIYPAGSSPSSTDHFMYTTDRDKAMVFGEETVKKAIALFLVGINKDFSYKVITLVQGVDSQS